MHTAASTECTWTLLYVKFDVLQGFKFELSDYLLSHAFHFVRYCPVFELRYSTVSLFEKIELKKGSDKQINIQWTLFLFLFTDATHSKKVYFSGKNSFNITFQFLGQT